jgi:TatD DNase family protein
MHKLKYIDIHTHTYYHDPGTTLVLNLFPGEQEKLELPVYFSAGLHPWHVQQHSWEKEVEWVRKICSDNKKILAVGEAGLDKAVGIHYHIQQAAFSAQLSLAETLRKPLILHCVRSYNELLSVRKKSDQSIAWIFHWFNADEQTANELIRKNCFLSFGHMLFNERSKAFRVFKTLPMDRVFFETDEAGYSIREIYNRAAGIRNLSLSNLETQIMDNFNYCFQL